MKAYLLFLEPEAGRDLVAVDVEPLRRDVDVDPAVAVRNGEPGLGPEERLVLDAELVDPADAHVAGRVGISVPNHDRAEDVRPRVLAEPVARGWVLLVQRLLLGCALRVDDRLERLVLDSDLLGGSPGLLGVLGGDECDRLTEVADAVAREHRLIGELEAVGLRPGHVVVREDGVDAGHLQRLAEVDLEDPGMRVRAPERVAPEHSRSGEVARVGELAGYFRDRVGPPDGFADASELKLARGGAHAFEAASRTASKIFA